ncbi:N-acetylmuramoyl-L-alanine amidase [Weissella tructae]
MSIAESRLGNIARGYDPKGVVIHNDAGGNAANVAFYKSYLWTAPLENGFAHYYVASDGVLQVANESSIAWHTANANGNRDFIGIEACQSMGDLAQFKKNEERSIKLAAEVLMRYNLPANRSTVILHKQFVATACPHRSVELHGDYEKVQDYFIARIKEHMAGKNVKPEYQPKPQKPAKTAIEQFKLYGNQFTAYKTFRVDAMKKVNGIWQFVNYDLAGSKNVNWINNGIPLAIVDNITRGNQEATRVGDRVKFSHGYNKGTIDAYDVKSNGVGIDMGAYGRIWFNADGLMKL